MEQTSSNYRNFSQIVNMFYNEEIENIEIEEKGLKDAGTIKIEPQIIYDKLLNTIKIEFKIGNKKMYKIKDLPEFYTHMLNEDMFSYGDKLSFVHKKEMFEDASQELLQFILKYAEIIKYANSNANSNYKYFGQTLNQNSITVSNTGLDELFEILKGKEIDFQRDYKQERLLFTEEEPQIKFYLKKDKEEYKIEPNIDIFKIILWNGRKNNYILHDNKLYKCTKEFEKTTFKMIKIFRENYLSELELGEKDLESLFSVILPKVKNAIDISKIDGKEIEKYKPKELIIKTFLDFEEHNYLVADVRFCYGENEFNPLIENKKINFPRNKIEETKAFNIFRKTGFMLDNKNARFILPQEENIYEFLTDDINYYMKKFDVLVTDNFKTKQIKQPKMKSLGIRVENNLLKIDLKDLQFDITELEEIMTKYSLKKKFHRLKDGSFIKLEDNDEIDFLDKMLSGMDVRFKDLNKEEITLPVNRTLYLNQLLKSLKGTEVVKNQEYKKIVNDLDKDKLEEAKVPKSLKNTLRYYQKVGYQWLKTVDNYKFGGILADDMGLGKTVQILSILVDYIENAKENKKASIVISPSSLTLNWNNEVNKFASPIKTLIISGSLNERKRRIEQIDEYDLVITSYDLLKRDIELYKQKDYNFKFIIADEAQYLKNSSTQNAKAIKRLKGETRYALTGTPIENSLAELWSIFDFIMPGYLFNYKHFKAMYEVPIVKGEDQKKMEKLKLLIEPFVLRRTKKEVLTELPEKTISILYNEMEEEQNKLYLSYLVQAKQEVKEQIDINGISKSHIQILAALTRLRQICCHPSLFIDKYHDGSSKLEQCMQIVEDAVAGNHKILLFSGYTSMFEIIEKELKSKGITYFKLTGATKVEDRIKLVEEFNNNKDIKVFLISLKAGGTGLNLIGADMVIHYDPWWNLGAENQATDRAYRIGQKNNVQVYKLITKNSIEEKIYELQQRKAKLADNLLSTQTSFISQLSKEDIMKLFE